jgi:hypothetical protein
MVCGGVVVPVQNIVAYAYLGAGHRCGILLRRQTETSAALFPCLVLSAAPPRPYGNVAKSSPAPEHLLQPRRRRRDPRNAGVCAACCVSNGHARDPLPHRMASVACIVRTITYISGGLRSYNGTLAWGTWGDWALLTRYGLCRPPGQQDSGGKKKRRPSSRARQADGACRAVVGVERVHTRAPIFLVAGATAVSFVSLVRGPSLQQGPIMTTRRHRGRLRGMQQVCQGRVRGCFGTAPDSSRVWLLKLQSATHRGLTSWPRGGGGGEGGRVS